MVYDTKLDFDKQNAITRFKYLLSKGKKIELTELTERTLNQNRYLHLIIGHFAINYGDSLDYCKKEFYKKASNRDLFEYEKTNKLTSEITKELKSSKDLTKEEMTLSIERFRKFSSENGIYLPSSDEREFLNSIDFELKKHKNMI